MKAVFFLIFLVISNIANAYSIVFVHIGPSLPLYLPVTISQARLFNKQCSLYLVASESALFDASQQLESDNVILVPYESLARSQAHVKFNNIPNHNTGYQNLWIYTSERFLYLDEFISQYNLSDVFHLENDVLLYVNLEELLPVFQKHYSGMMGTTFPHINRGCASVVYISNPAPLQAFVQCFSEPVHDFHSDMEILSQFDQRYHKVWVDSLPIVMPEYAIKHPFDPSIGNKVGFFSNHIDEFKSIFDGQALGIYIAGWDSRFHPSWASQPGQVEGHTIFNSSHFTYEWETDSEGRRVPFLYYEGKKWPINNLHLHNKSKISLFHSKRIAFP